MSDPTFETISTPAPADETPTALQIAGFLARLNLDVPDAVRNNAGLETHARRRINAGVNMSGIGGVFFHSRRQNIEKWGRLSVTGAADTSFWLYREGDLNFVRVHPQGFLNYVQAVPV